MFKVALYASLLAAGVAFAPLPLEAKDLYVAPGGTPAGPGTLSSPYDLATALSGQVGRPGDTFWLRGGDYSLGHVNTTIQGAPGHPFTFRQVKGENARIDGSINIFDSIGYVVLRDFELYSSDTDRVSSQTGVGFNVTDIRIIPGVACYAPNVSLINLVVHDQTRHGIYLSERSTNVLVYGCVIYNNGWVSPDNAEGHGLYVQGIGGTRTLADNIVFNNSGANLHVYDNADGAVLRGITLDGNVAFNSGALQHVRPYRDWIVGVDFPSQFADGIVMRNNMGYQRPGEVTDPELQIGRSSTNGTITLTGNYMAVGLEVNNWRRAIVLRNVFGPAQANYLVTLTQMLKGPRAYWNNNTYILDPPGQDFLLNSQPYTTAGWQAATRFDSSSKFAAGPPQAAKVFVRRNRYDVGRANVVVYNWGNLDNVAVNPGSALRRNGGFDLRNAEDLSAPPALSGVFQGGRLNVPMTNLTVAVVNGPPGGALSTPPPTGPTFNVFVLTRTATQ